MKTRGDQAELIRQEARTRYIDPARRRGETTVQIRAMEVLKDLNLGGDRAPAVCSALKTRKFLEDNHLLLENREGPAKMQSTTVRFTYRLLGEKPEAGRKQADALLGLWGIGKEVYAGLGGGEAFIRKERERFYKPDED